MRAVVPATELETGVVLTVGSAAALFQGAWLAALPGPDGPGFAAWLQEQVSLEGPPDGTAPPGWRYDLLAGSWAQRVGAERVSVLAGSPPPEALPEGLAERPPRPLGEAEVAMVEAYAAQLCELGRTGRVSAALLRGAADRLRSGTNSEVSAPAPPDPLAARVQRLTEEMAGAVAGSGIRVIGDPEALVWRRGHRRTAPEAVPMASVTGLAFGVLETTLEWQP